LIAVGLVIVGVIAETLCSVGLFVNDEGITAAQRGTIASQQRQIISLIGSNKNLEDALDHQGRKIVAANTRLETISARADKLSSGLDDLKSGQFTLGNKQNEADRRLSAQNLRLGEAASRISETRSAVNTVAKRLAWRVLPPDTIKELETAFSFGQTDGGFMVWYIDGDEEAESLAAQFATVFRLANRRFDLAPVKCVRETIFGLWVPDRSEKDRDVVKELRSGLSYAKVQFSSGLITPERGCVMSARWNGPMNSAAGDALLFVGHHAPLWGGNLLVVKSGENGPAGTPKP
jgi:hypothetical protein